MESIQKLAERYIETKKEQDFKLLYGRMKPGMFTFVNKILKDEQASEDVMADAFVKMWKKIDQYNDNWNFSTWAYKILKNEAMQYIRKNGNTYSIENIGGEQMADRIRLGDFTATEMVVHDPDWCFDEEKEETISLYNKVKHEIESLPKLYKNIMMDREFEEMKYEDIAAKHGLELNTVKTRISRARQKITRAVLPQAPKKAKKKAPKNKKYEDNKDI